MLFHLPRHPVPGPFGEAPPAFYVRWERTARILGPCLLVMITGLLGALVSISYHLLRG